MNDNFCVDSLRAVAEQIFGAFLQELIFVHGCTIEEAFGIVRNEIKRAYDGRVNQRRAALTVFSQ